MYPGGAGAVSTYLRARKERHCLSHEGGGNAQGKDSVLRGRWDQLVGPIVLLRAVHRFGHREAV